MSALGFADETVSLLGGWALNSGQTLYRSFVDVHGPVIFMLTQAYGALFGWDNANGARVPILVLAVLAGLAIGTSPALPGGSRPCAITLYFGLLATVWLTQALYMVNYYSVPGAFAVILLAWFVVPACLRSRIPARAAAAAGVAVALLGFAGVHQCPSALLFSGGACLAAWRAGQIRAVCAHVIGLAASGLLLLTWLVVWGDLRGYLALHIYYALFVFPQFSSATFSGFFANLVPSLNPGRLVQSAGVILGTLGFLATCSRAKRPIRGRAAALAAAFTTFGGFVLLDARGSAAFNDGPLVMCGIGWFALVVPGLFRRYSITPVALAVVVITELVLRHATYTPSGLTRAQFLAVPPTRMAERQDSPMFDEIRRVTRPDERILALVYAPQTYFSAGRLPPDQVYTYLPMDAAYAKRPALGQLRDLCRILDVSPPPAIVFDNWVVWGRYAPIDYMPCLFGVLARTYRYVPEPGDVTQKLYVRNDRKA